MRIIRLQAEGFKRLLAVDISPEGDLIEIRGNNGNGKSSVLDAIFAAVGGAGAAPVKPVREGEEAAVIRLELGDREPELLVTRYFTEAGTTGLKVTSPDGKASYNSAQTMLDDLVGAISFDPLAFRDLKPAEQAEELRKLVSIVNPDTGELLDLEKLAASRKELFDNRRDVNRDAKALVARIEALGGIREVPEGAPDPAELRSRLASAAEDNERVHAARRKREEYAGAVAGLEAEEKRLIDALEVVRGKLEQGRKALDELPEPGELVDVSALTKELEDAERIADNRRHNENRDRLKAEFAELKSKSEKLSGDIRELDELRAHAIAAAEMPVEGLKLEAHEDGALSVLFDGVPFSQASDAERLRVSAAVAMAANPKLRVLRLKDASLLDKAAIEALRAMATENDFQIWAEFVGDEGAGIIMEAGEVRGAEKPEPLPKPRQRKKAEDGDEVEAPRKSGEDRGEATVSSESKSEAAGSNGALFADEETPPARKPRALSEFNSKPKGE